ncbi:hypothetical protein C1D09_018835 [Mesorhizobium intechi]|uniref:hypothetical protein n=1 Tax=Mesorhizobium intechi TaxID=537601 RepID=UPI000CC136C0|nr:hypothetical protein [Mesorhizobium intechi]TSE07589.1 hypothetical protein C1D09_018835 [Mesorhizobium intechi]
MTPGFRVTAVKALAYQSEAVERMLRFLAEHQAAHGAPRTPAGDLVAAALEREYWKRWPEGRDD